MRQTELIRQAWAESGKVYGYRKLTHDLREQISENRVARLASLAGIAAQMGYKRRPGRYGGKPAIVAENKLGQQFSALDLSRFSAAPSARLSHLSFESDRAFPTQC